MEFLPLTLESKTTIDGFLRDENFLISDIVFGNLFIWKDAREITYALCHDTLIIKTTYPHKEPYFFYPIGKGDKIQALKEIALYAQSLQIPLCFESVQQCNIAGLKSVFGEIEITPAVEHFDYVYLVQELINLSGRKFHKKKNHLNQFLLNYPQWQYKKITQQNAKDIIEVATQWFENTPNPTQGLISEHIGIKNALKVYDKLNLSGGFVHIDGKIIAFSFGEQINNEMVVIHIEKATNEIPGAYQIINQQLLVNEFSHFVYVNREEDLGIEGLKRAKKSYNPVFMVEKFRTKIPYEIYTSKVKS